MPPHLIMASTARRTTSTFLSSFQNSNRIRREGTSKKKSSVSQRIFDKGTTDCTLVLCTGVLLKWKIQCRNKEIIDHDALQN
jgi:hypothetical protein